MRLTIALLLFFVCSPVFGAPRFHTPLGAGAYAPLFRSTYYPKGLPTKDHPSRGYTYYRYLHYRPAPPMDHYNRYKPARYRAL
jgi:hypothetical protein